MRVPDRIRGVTVAALLGALALSSSCASPASGRRYGAGFPSGFGGGSSGGGTISDGSVTNAKLANVASATFKGRATAGTGAPEDLTATQATALLNVATTSAAGTMSATDKLVATMDNNAWYAARIAEIKALVPQVTACKKIPIGVVSPGGAASQGLAPINTAGEGGSSAGNGATLSRFSSNVGFTLKTGKWGLGVRGVYASPVAGHYERIGFVNSAGSHLYSFTSYSGTIDATHFAIEIVGTPGNNNVVASGTGSVVPGGAIDLTLAGDGTTLTAQVAGNTVATSALTNVADEAVSLFSQGQLGTDAYALLAVYCYVAP